MEMNTEITILPLLEMKILLLKLNNYRGELVRRLDKALESGLLTQRERDIFYFRHIDWNSLETVGKKFGVTRERIRQIEAKVLEKLRGK